MHLDRYRRAAIAFVAASSFSLASTGAAVARPLEPPGLPAPTPLVLHPSPVAPGVPPGASQATSQAATVPADMPIRVPATTKATLGKFILVLLALVGIVVLVAIGIIAYALWDIRTDNE